MGFENALKVTSVSSQVWPECLMKDWEILLLLFSKQRSETFLYFIDAEDATGSGDTFNFFLRTLLVAEKKSRNFWTKGVKHYTERNNRSGIKITKGTETVLLETRNWTRSRLVIEEFGN